MLLRLSCIWLCVVIPTWLEYRDGESAMLVFGLDVELRRVSGRYPVSKLQMSVKCFSSRNEFAAHTPRPVSRTRNRVKSPKLLRGQDLGCQRCDFKGVFGSLFLSKDRTSNRVFCGGSVDCRGVVLHAMFLRKFRWLSLLPLEKSSPVNGVVDILSRLLYWIW